MIKSGHVRDLYRSILNVSTKVFGVKFTKELDARIRFHRNLDLDNPHTLADKVSWMELNTDRSIAAKLTDKYEVRQYVADKGLESILIPLCGGPWKAVEDIDISELPDSFVIKATHGCEMNFICKDKRSIDVGSMRCQLRRWLESDYPRACIEPHYKLIPHRLYAEELIGGMDGVIDYKFHCLNGEPCFILACSNREHSVKLNLYDLEWNEIPGIQGIKANNHGLKRPLLLPEMIDIARALSSDFDFVRVDLYETNKRIRFGELTFTPASGVFPNFTEEFIEYWGSKLRIGNKQRAV